MKSNRLAEPLAWKHGIDAHHHLRFWNLEKSWPATSATATSSLISLQARDNFRRIRMFEEAQGLIEELSADVGPQLELEDTNEATAQNQKTMKNGG